MNDISEILNLHAKSCDILQQLVTEENRYLKGARRVPEEAFLNRKRAALGSLTASLYALRQAVQAQPGKLTAHRGAMEKMQQIIMKTLLVDRENEQLLLSCTMRDCMPAPTPQLSPAQLQRMYNRN